MSAPACCSTLEWLFCLEEITTKLDLSLGVARIKRLRWIDARLTCCRCFHVKPRNISVCTSLSTLLCHRYLATHLCVYWWMHAQRASVCAQPCRAHARARRWPREWRVMPPAERHFVKRCNVCARRGCQHHRPLSWPGFLTQHFLCEPIGPDTNFLAELHCGRCNLIAATPLTPSSGPLLSSSDRSSESSQLSDGRPVDAFFRQPFWSGSEQHIHPHTHAHCPQLQQTDNAPCCPVCLKQRPVRALRRCCSHCQNSNVQIVTKMLPMLFSPPYFCLCIAISCSV